MTRASKITLTTPKWEETLVVTCIAMSGCPRLPSSLEHLPPECLVLHWWWKHIGRPIQDRGRGFESITRTSILSPACLAGQSFLDAVHISYLHLTSYIYSLSHDKPKILGPNLFCYLGTEARSGKAWVPLTLFWRNFPLGGKGLLFALAFPEAPFQYQKKAIEKCLMAKALIVLRLCFCRVRISFPLIASITTNSFIEIKNPQTHPGNTSEGRSKIGGGGLNWLLENLFQIQPVRQDNPFLDAVHISYLYLTIGRSGVTIDCSG